jgi:Reverse transcriptase (RNA-dependent DNA polymerase)
VEEILALQKLNCFKVVEDNSRWHPAQDGYQFAPLQIVFDVKPDGRRKARVVAGGHVVTCDVNTYASMVKTLSVRLLHVIADANKLTTLCGDIGNAFVNSYTNEKIYTRAGPEFGPSLQGRNMIIEKSLYGLKSSAKRWRAHFASTLRGMGFCSSRADQDVLLRERDDGSGYDYICTHVDDFLIFAKDPWQYMNVIQDMYVVRDIGPPKYYLGNNFFRDRDGNSYIGSSTYVTEAIRKVEEKVGVLTKECSPCAEGDHPELDESPLLGPDDTHRDAAGYNL